MATGLIRMGEARYVKNSAAERGLANCHGCGKLSPVELGKCPRCGSALHLRNHNSLQTTTALIVTAAILYIPANLFPVMINSKLGTSEGHTILEGVAIFLSKGDYVIGLVILIASVLIPLAKLLALAWLCWMIRKGGTIGSKRKTQLYRVTEAIGRWSMIDVFVVAILVALIQLGNLMSINPGPAAVAFAGVVITTMIAAETLDSRLIWDRAGENDV